MHEQVIGVKSQPAFRIPSYFKNHSHHYEDNPSFLYVSGKRSFKIHINTADPKKRKICYGKQFTLLEMKMTLGSRNPEFVDVHFSSDSSQEFEKVIFNEAMLKRWLGVSEGAAGYNHPAVVFLSRPRVPLNSI